MLACSSRKRSNIEKSHYWIRQPFSFGHQVVKIRQGKKHCLVPIQGHKVQQLLVTWGQIENFYSYFSLDS
jgi:hypothetical protein